MNDNELRRYEKHLMCPSIDYEGQEALARATVCQIGVGGLGCAVSQYLVSSGLGNLHLYDADVVELSNLPRQVLFSEQHVGKAKVKVAQTVLAQCNSKTCITAHEQHFDAKACLEGLEAANIVVDCSDNFRTRFFINRLCYQHRKVLVSASAIGFLGQLIVFDFRRCQGPCYQCLFDDLPEEQVSCSEQGVLAPLVGVMGAMQAVEVIKILTNQKSKTSLLRYDAATATFSQSVLSADPSCEICG